MNSGHWDDGTPISLSEARRFGRYLRSRRGWRHRNAGEAALVFRGREAIRQAQAALRRATAADREIRRCLEALGILC